jgi:diguanylate cyclase (GGDEF)-like protein
MAAAEKATASPWGILMMLDLDNFKNVNDTYGQTFGDDCVRAIADVLRDQVRSEDLVGRLGRKKFATFLIDSPIDAARLIGVRLCAGAEINLADADQALNITGYVGAVEMAQQDNLGAVLSMADMHMYQEKDAGRAGQVFWEKVATSNAIADGT